ncbi:HET-domain-containing protein, partial [Plenodomus tracheiphilus IPT5]
WLERCSTHHEECQAPVSKKIDIIRVIDVVKRVLVSYRNCNFARYAALSYVWGKAFQPRMGDLKDLPQVLPRTIEHALLAVQQMGLRYLWVDSICIKQDSPEDKAEQISIMGDIYAGAFMTLIALDGADADSGLAGVNQAVPRTPQPFLNIGSLRLMARCPRFDYALRNSPWMQRGWTYQEGILSRRCIFISTSQVYYLCNTMYCSE